MLEIATGFLVGLVSLFLVIRYSHVHCKYTGDHDTAGIQKFHPLPVPRVGGLGVFLGTSSAAICGYLYVIRDVPDALTYVVLLSSLPAFAGGIAEDLTKKVGVSTRFVLTAISSLICGALLDAWIVSFDVEWLDVFLKYSIVSIFVTCFAVTGVTNSFNLIDGYNGLLGVVAVIVLAGLSYVASQVGDDGICIVANSAIGAVMGFLVLNYPRGSIFMGDGGAYFCGFLVAELSILLVVRNSEVSPWFPLALAYYPIFETVYTIYRRSFVYRTSTSSPDAAHLHQLIFANVVKWHVGSECPKNRILRNAMTAPYLWIVCSISAIPSVFFWRDSDMLQYLVILSSVFYVVLYKRILNGSFPGFLTVRSHK